MLFDFPTSVEAGNKQAGFVILGLKAMFSAQTLPAVLHDCSQLWHLRDHLCYIAWQRCCAKEKQPAQHLPHWKKRARRPWNPPHGCSSGAGARVSALHFCADHEKPSKVHALQKQRLFMDIVPYLPDLGPGRLRLIRLQQKETFSTRGEHGGGRNRSIYDALCDFANQWISKPNAD